LNGVNTGLKLDS